MGGKPDSFYMPGKPASGNGRGGKPASGNGKPAAGNGRAPIGGNPAGIGNPFPAANAAAAAPFIAFDLLDLPLPFFPLPFPYFPFPLPLPGGGALAPSAAR